MMLKAKIEIDFKKINHFDVNSGLLKNNPELIKSTLKIVDILCKQIEKYFKDNKIIVGTKFQLDNDK